jgi:hypothetical protein
VKLILGRGLGLLGGFGFGFGLGLGLTLRLALLDLGGDDGVRLLDEIVHRGVRLLLLETLEDLRWVGNRRFVRLGVELGVLVARLEIVLLRILNHVALALLEHLRRFALVLPVSLHEFFQLFVGVVGILNLRRVRWDEKPLVEVDDVDVEGRVLLLQTLRVRRGLVPRRKGAANLDSELVRLLRTLRADDGEAGERLTRDGGEILREGHSRFFYG